MEREEKAEGGFVARAAPQNAGAKKGVKKRRSRRKFLYLAKKGKESRVAFLRSLFFVGQMEMKRRTWRRRRKKK